MEEPIRKTKFVPEWMREADWLFKLQPELQSMMYCYIGGNPVESPELATRASADSRIAPNPPAFYLQHGDKDPAANVLQSIRFHDKLSATGYFKEGDLVLDILEGAPHAGAGPEFLEPKNVMPIIEFFKRHMQ